MSDLPDFHHRDQMEAWLKGHPPEISVQFAHRAAMRVAPIFWEWRRRQSRDLDLTEVFVARALIISGVAALGPTLDMRVADAAAAAFAADAAAAYPFNAAAASNATFAAYAANAAAYAAAAADAYASNAAASNASNAASKAYAAAAGYASDAFASDAAMIENGKIPLTARLWPEASPLQPTWAKVRTTWRKRGGMWDVFADWYSRALNGQKQNWDKLTEIAVLPPDVWEDDEAELERQILDIQARYAIAATPNAEKIVEDPRTGLLRVEEVTALPGENLTDVKTKVRLVASELERDASHNQQYGALRPEIDMLLNAVSREGIRALALHDACRRAIRRIARKAELGECPKNDPLLDDVITELQEAQLDILNFDQHARTVVSARAEVAFRDLPVEAKQKIAEGAAVVAGQSEDGLATELVEDAEIASDANSDPEDRRNSLYRLGSRLGRIWRAANNFVRNAKEGTEDVAGLSANVAKILGGPTALYLAAQFLFSVFT